ncbi:hypothetical protein KUCAC02_004679, partial [Chaenocephalus aceratus]
RKPRLLFDGAVAIPSAYLPPNYADVDGTGTLRSAYNYDAYLTTGSRTSDFKFVSSYNDNTLPADQTLRKSPSDFAEVFGDCDSSPENGRPPPHPQLLRKPRLLFDGAVAIPSAYLPPNYADVDGTGTLRSAYNYDAYLTTGSRTSDFNFVSSSNDNTLPADQTLRKSPSDFAEVFGDFAIPSAYLPPNYADVDGTGTLRSAYNYDAYLTTGSRTSDFKFVSSSNDNTLPADQTLRKSPSDFAEVFGDFAIPSAYLPPNYADVDGTGTLRSAYNYDAYLTTGSRTSDFKFVSSYNDNTLPADQTLRKSPSDFAEVFGDYGDGTGTLRSAYNYDAYLTTGSRTSDFNFVSSSNDNTLPADQTLRKSPSDFAEVFGDCDSSPE